MYKQIVFMALQERERSLNQNSQLLSVVITCSPNAVPIVEETLGEHGIFFGPSSKDQPRLPSCEETENQCIPPDRVIFRCISSPTQLQELSDHITPQIQELDKKENVRVWVIQSQPLNSDPQFPLLHTSSEMFNLN